MKLQYVFRLAIVVMVVGTFFGVTRTAKADAGDDSGTVTAISCNGLTGTVTLTIQASEGFDIDVSANGVEELLDFDSASGSGTYSMSDPSIVVGTVVTVAGTNISATCGNPTTFCAVGSDGRIAPLCGDRIAIYCHTSVPGTLDIWGVGNDSLGFDLKSITFAELVKAGPKGISFNLGKLGVLSIALGGQNNFWVAWNGQINPATGGTFYANGQPNQGFAKGFQCNYVG